MEVTSAGLLLVVAINTGLTIIAIVSLRILSQRFEYHLGLTVQHIEAALQRTIDDLPLDIEGHNPMQHAIASFIAKAADSKLKGNPANLLQNQD